LFEKEIFCDCVFTFVEGWNNNPNAGEFQGVLRCMLYRCGMESLANANVTAQDSTAVISVMTVNSFADDGMDDVEDATDGATSASDDSCLIHDHAYISPVLNPLVQNALVHIASWVAQKLMKSVTCNVSGQLASRINSQNSLVLITC